MAPERTGEQGKGLVIGDDGLARCWWCGDDPLYRGYHDQEWGMPLRDERALFELLSLEGFQSGLSWITILRKRVSFREAFDGFVPKVVAGYDDDDILRMLADPGIVRHRGKIVATVANARAVLQMQASGTSLTEIVWSHAPALHPMPPASIDEVPSESPESVELARVLRRWGLRYVGPTTVYAFMQAAGIVDDHILGCWRGGIGHEKRRNGPRSPKPKPKPAKPPKRSKADAALDAQDSESA
jgi:DNA-3-methyladenine glycosylase I